MRYSAFELKVDSELPLLGFSALEPGDDETDVDVTIKLGELPEAPEEGLPWTVADSEVTLWIKGVGAYRAREGREVVVAPEEKVPLSRVALGLRGSMWAALMMQRGLIPIHASCLYHPDGGILLFGPVGVGKSTLATALNYKGFEIVSDEMTVLRRVDGSVEVVPSYPEIRLWANALEAFGIPREAWGRPVRPPLLKFSLPVPNWHSEPCRPRAMFFLSQRRDPDIEVRPLPQLSALGQVHRMLYRSRFLAEMPDQAGSLRDVASDLVQTATGFALAFPEELDLVPEVCEQVLEHWSSVPVRPTPHWSQTLSLPRFHLVPERPVPDDFEGLRGLVLLASYPKSGNTWMRALLTAWRVRNDEDVANLEAMDGGHPLSQRHHLDEVLGVESDYMVPVEILERRSDLHKVQAPLLATPTLIKTHDLCSRGRDGELLYPPETVAGVLFVVRCPLDVVGSAMNHFQLSAADTVKMMANDSSWGALRPGGITERTPERTGSWSAHARSWVESDYRVLVVRYEDLLADTLGQLKRIIEFFEFPWDEERGRLAVEKTRFDKLQQQEKQKGFLERPIGTAAFFRKGKSGTWRETLAPELARQVVEDHGEMMRRLGYGAEVDEVLAWGPAQEEPQPVSD